MTQPIRVFLVDDHEIVRRGVTELLEGTGDFEVVGQAGTVADALMRIPLGEPDVVVIDVRLPDASGIELCREIRSRHPAIGCLMLTSFDDDEALLDAALAGAHAYVLKQIRGRDIIEAARAVANGTQLLSPSVVRRAVDRAAREAPAEGALDALTPRERDVFDLIGHGMSNRQIGEALGLAEKTIKNQVSGLFAKLGLSRRTEVAAMSARLEERDAHRA